MGGEGENGVTGKRKVGGEPMEGRTLDKKRVYEFYGKEDGSKTEKKKK